MKRIFICSAYRGDTEENIRKTKEYCRWAATECGAVPIAPHLLYPQFLDDDNSSERELGIQCGLEILECCGELWCFGNFVTEGMEKEINHARKLNITVKYVSEAEMDINKNINTGGMFYD